MERGNYMARIKESYIRGYLTNKLFEAIKPLNQVKDALEPTEQELIGEIEGIIKKIILIEI